MLIQWFQFKTALPPGQIPSQFHFLPKNFLRICYNVFLCSLLTGVNYWIYTLLYFTFVRVLWFLTLVNCWLLIFSSLLYYFLIREANLFSLLKSLPPVEHSFIREGNIFSGVELVLARTTVSWLTESFCDSNDSFWRTLSRRLCCRKLTESERSEA